MTEPQVINTDQANRSMLPGNEMAEIVADYIVETKDLIEQLGHDLLELESRPNDKELQKQVFRLVHTVKGTSSFLGFEQMAELTHSLEDVLNKLRKDAIELTSHVMDVVFESHDLMKVLLDRIETNTEGGIEIAHATKLLSEIAGAAEDSQTATETKSSNNDGPEAPAIGTKKEVAKALASDSFIRVDVNRLNSLMDLVGELVIARNRLGQIAQQSDHHSFDSRLSEQITDTSSSIDFITTELQMAVMQTRMVTIDKVFGKLPRLVRDLSKELNKEIELQIESEATELDKSIIDELNDPLVHILRNAADHAIEAPENRLAAGKPAKGKITVRAEREGNYIVISIQDDGRGIDPEKIKRTALDRGLVTEARAKEMTKRDALQMIFEAGFSTAGKVTNVSGRGVGLDVVFSNISKLKGIVEVDSEVNIGTTFRLRIPLTLAIVEGLLVEDGSEIISIPLNSVLEVLRVRTDEMETINGKRVFCHRDSILPLASLDETMNGVTKAETVQWKYIVVVGFAEQRFGIIVDKLLGQKELVIKNLGSYLGSIPGIAGSTILGDGKVIMIVDVGQFMKLCSERN